MATPVPDTQNKNNNNSFQICPNTKNTQTSSSVVSSGGWACYIFE